jgi:hypothetical protein
MARRSAVTIRVAIRVAIVVVVAVGGAADGHGCAEAILFIVGCVGLFVYFFFFILFLFSSFLPLPPSVLGWAKNKIRQEAGKEKEMKRAIYKTSTGPDFCFYCMRTGGRDAFESVFFFFGNRSALKALTFPPFRCPSG